MTFTIDTCDRDGHTYTEAEYPAFLNAISNGTHQCCATSNASISRALLTHLHIKDPFKVDGLLRNAVRNRPTYNEHALQDVTTSFLSRILYIESCVKMNPRSIYLHTVLAGIRIPDETLCCAAALNGTSAGFNWLKTIFKIDRRVRVTRDGKLITDAYGDSILSIVSCDNVRRLLKKIHAEGVTELQVPSSRVIDAVKSLPHLKFTIIYY